MAKKSTHASSSSAVHNHLLRALPGADLERLQPHFERCEFPIRTVLLETNSVIEHVYFPDSGTVSMLTELEDAARIEVGMIGSEGMVGLPVLLGSEISPFQAIVQVGAAAWRLPTPRLKAAAPSWS